MLDIDHIHFQTVCDNQTVLVAYKYETYPKINFDAENILGFWSSEETPTIEEMPFVVQSFYEVADLWFHSIVMLGYFDLDPQEVLDELARRQGLSGLVEKANRSKEA